MRGKDKEILIRDLLVGQYEKYYRMAYSYVHSESDAMDIVQEAAYKAIYHAKKLKQQEFADTWICRIVINEAKSEEISRQMQSQIVGDGAFYYLKNQEDPDGFEAISQDQNFYFNSEGQLVIVFDEYDVAPGSEGCPEFVIADAVWRIK